MKLHFLGTTGYHPNNNRQTACFMLPELGVVLDAGTGFFRVRELLQTKTLDIFLTHVHLDHVIGLTFLYDVLCDKEMERVTVHLAAEKIEAVRQHLYAEQLFPVPPNFEFRALSAGQPVNLGGDATLTAFPVSHPGGCHAFRLDWPDRSFAYVTDTTADPASEYVSFIRGVDTLVHECYFADGWEDKAQLTGHSCLSPVAEVAAAAGVGQCYLVHIDPLNESRVPLDLESVKSIFSGLVVPADQDVVTI